MLPLVLTAVVLAQPASTPATHLQFDSDLRGYFGAEVFESWLFVGLGAATIGTGSYFFTRSDSLLLGAAGPLIGVGLIQLVVGLAVLVRTNTQVAALLALSRTDPTRFVTEESARMRVVNRNFVIYRWVELALLTVGAGLLIAGAVADQRALLGVGGGLAFQSAAMLTFDFFAERRALRWTAQLPSAATLVAEPVARR